MPVPQDLHSSDPSQVQRNVSRMLDRINEGTLDAMLNDVEKHLQCDNNAAVNLMSMRECQEYPEAEDVGQAIASKRYKVDGMYVAINASSHLQVKLQKVLLRMDRVTDWC